MPTLQSVMLFSSYATTYMGFQAKYVVVGAGASGRAAIRTLHARSPSASIILIADAVPPSRDECTLVPSLSVHKQYDYNGVRESVLNAVRQLNLHNIRVIENARVSDIDTDSLVRVNALSCNHKCGITGAEIK